VSTPLCSLSFSLFSLRLTAGILLVLLRFSACAKALDFYLRPENAAALQDLHKSTAVAVGLANDSDIQVSFLFSFLSLYTQTRTDSSPHSSSSSCHRTTSAKPFVSIPLLEVSFAKPNRAFRFVTDLKSSKVLSSTSTGPRSIETLLLSPILIKSRLIVILPSTNWLNLEFVLVSFSPLLSSPPSSSLLFSLPPKLTLVWLYDDSS